MSSIIEYVENANLSEIAQAIEICDSVHESWGEILHSDSTVRYELSLKFSDLNTFSEAWNMLKSIRRSKGTLNNLSVVIPLYREFEEYVDAIKETGEEE